MGIKKFKSNSRRFFLGIKSKERKKIIKISPGKKWKIERLIDTEPSKRIISFSFLSKKESMKNDGKELSAEITSREFSNKKKIPNVIGV